MVIILLVIIVLTKSQDIILNDGWATSTKIGFNNGSLSYICSSAPFKNTLYYLTPTKLNCTNPQMSFYLQNTTIYNVNLLSSAGSYWSNLLINKGIFISTYLQLNLFLNLDQVLTYFTPDYVVNQNVPLKAGFYYPVYFDFSRGVITFIVNNSDIIYYNNRKSIFLQWYPCP